MDVKTSDWRPGPTVCRCCLTEGCYKDISTEYFWMGKREVYAEMLSETLNVSIAYSQSTGPNSNSRLICEPCISRLRDATDFRRQVLECEKTFMQHLDPGSSSVQKELRLTHEDVKLEKVKQEKRQSDDEDFDDRVDFVVDNDDDDDLDDEPLMKLASKVPKKEVDLMKLLDSSQITVKRKATTKSKEPPTKKTKKQIILKPSASKAAKPSVSSLKVVEKKKKGTKRAVTSHRELTVSERTNASTIVQLTTAKPFVNCRYYFKCFFCHEHYFDIKKLLNHTSTHEVPDQTKILKELLKKGTKTLKVDISELKCRICQLEFIELDTIRKHLVIDHSIAFTESGNGLVAYNLATKNDQFCCHICTKKFQTFNLLNRHMNIHFSNLVCEVCGAGFMTRQRFIQHKEIHQPGGYPCTRCSKVYTTSSNLKFHIEKAHEGNRKMRMLRCPHCSERFTEHFRKIKHLKEAHNICFSYECDVCKSVFPSRRALTTHTNRHHSEKTQCEVCKKCFSCITTLRTHKLCHSGERNHSCDICQKTYRQKKSLKYHMRTHINGDVIIKFTCPECNSGFPSRNDFNKHVKEWHPSRYFDYVVVVESL